MRDKKSPDILDWLCLKNPPDFTKLRMIGAGVCVIMVPVVFLLFVLAILTAFKMLGTALFGTLLQQPGSALGVGGVTMALIGAHGRRRWISMIRTFGASQKTRAETFRWFLFTIPC